jgi:hypothetical protein
VAPRRRYPVSASRPYATRPDMPLLGAAFRRVPAAGLLAVLAAAFSLRLALDVEAGGGFRMA